jgi:hypothetical protein
MLRTERSPEKLVGGIYNISWEFISYFSFSSQDEKCDGYFSFIYLKRIKYGATQNLGNYIVERGDMFSFLRVSPKKVFLLV